MAWRLVKQPNGLFGVFSEIVDNFTQINLSEFEASNFCAERGLNNFESLHKIDSAKKDFLPFSRTPGTGLSRWNDCLKTIKRIHGNDEADNVVWEDESGIKSQIKFKLKER